MMNILAVGDVCGKGGLDLLSRSLRKIKKNYAIDFCVVNGENANVVGVTPDQCEQLLDAGADCITLGNHTWVRTEIQRYLDESSLVLRPLNFSSRCPGRGWAVFETPKGRVAVINAIGRVELDNGTDNPFIMINSLLKKLEAEVVLLDFHAEATSEKRAMGYFLDGRASAVWGTHTHVQTSDACVLPKGTGYITDLGMTGPVHSVLGIDPQQSIGKFLGDPPRRYASAQGECRLEGAIFEIDEATGRCVSAEALRIT